MISPVVLADINDGLIAYYPFEGNALDASGNSYDGTVYGAILYSQGVKGLAADFNGINDSIETFSFDYEHRSISVWVNADDDYIETSTDQYADRRAFTMLSYELEYGGVILGFKNGSIRARAAQYPIYEQPSAINTWYHVVLIRNGEESKIYINGELVHTADSGRKETITAAANKNLIIGSGREIGSSYYGRYFDGLIDEVRIYNRALLESEVQQLYEGTEISLDDFQISLITSPQTVGTPFLVTLQALDNYGNNYDDFNGSVNLYSNAGDKSVSPTVVTLIDGKWSGNVTLNEAGSNLYLACTSGSVTGHSDKFDVGGLSSNLGNISGKIMNSGGALIQEDVEVTLTRNINEVVKNAIFSSGSYHFSDVESGYYILTADHPEALELFHCIVFIPSESRNITKDITIVFCNNCAEKTPVLLVPGIMGSASTNDGGWFPQLPVDSPDWDSDQLKIFDWWDTAGWDTLKEKLVENGYVKGCTYFEVPYDWRLDLDIAKDKYLKNWINKAKLISGKNKVNIIAHSMGGLLTRAYIQSFENELDIDIEKFAMVGTPNMGSANAYYIWEGGNPKLTDDIVIDIFTIYFYWNTTQENYELSNGNLDLWEYEKIWNYYTSGDPQGNKKLGVYGAKQLLPTYAFLGHENPKTLEKVKNDFLLSLNSDQNKYYMGIPGAGKIDTIIFCSRSKKTISTIGVGEPNPNNKFYLDGSPLRNRNDGGISSAQRPEGNGDGTVLETSADLPYQEGWAEKHIVSGAHAGLIGESADDLISFLNGTLVYSKSLPDIMPKSGLQTKGAENGLFISIKGRPQPYLIAPSGLGVGIEPTSNAMQNNIPDAEIYLNTASSYIEIKNVESGTYTLQLKNVYSEDYFLNVAVSGDIDQSTGKLHGFINGATVSLTIQVDLTSDERISILHEPNTIENLQTTPVGTTEILTQLAWNASEDQDVVHYNVYSKEPIEPYFKFLASTGNLFFDTTHPWVSNSTPNAQLYSITAVLADGTESFLSTTVTNNDQDGDGLTDVFEIDLNTAIDNPDSDGDGMTDGEEYYRGTNPIETDTDGDMFSDAIEEFFGSDPLSTSSIPPAGPDFEPDNDIDGYDISALAKQIQAEISQISIEDFASEFGSVY